MLSFAFPETLPCDSGAASFSGCAVSRSFQTRGATEGAGLVSHGRSSFPVWTEHRRGTLVLSAFLFVGTERPLSLLIQRG